MLNITQIPAARVALTEPDTGLITTQWYRFLVNMYTLIGEGTGVIAVANGGTGQTSYTDGQLLIGNSTGNTLDKATLTAGAGIVITNGPGSIRLDVALPTNLVNTFSAGTTGFTPIAPVTGDVTLAGNLLSTRVDYTAPYTSAVVRTGNSKWSDIVSVKDFGAVGNGSTNDTAAIQAAINTGKHVYFPTGTYYITNALTINTQGQTLSGDGQRRSAIYVNGSFNMSATGVIVFGDGDIELHNLWIKFYQPDTSSRGSLISYPVTIYAYNRAGFKITSCSITNATYGIDMRGNTGQAQIDDLAMSAYYTGVQIDGALDTIRINKYHFWNFEMTGNQASIFYTSPTRGFSVGRVDGLMISQYLNISNLGLYMYQGSSGPPWVYITESGFDTWNGISQNAGRLQVDNSYITNADGGGYYSVYMNAGGGFSQYTNCFFFLGPSNGVAAIRMEGGNSMTLTNCYFSNYINGGPVIYQNSNAGNSLFSMSDCTFDFGSANGLCMWSEGNAAQKVHLVNNYINTTANTAYSGPMFQFQPGCRIYMTGNRVNDKGANAATFIQNNGDNFNWISGNIAPGWTNAGLGGATGYYANNLT